MQLYLEILKNILESEETHIVFPNLKMDPKEIVEIESYRARQNIKKVLKIYFTAFFANSVVTRSP